MRRIASLFLVLTLVFALTVPAMAADDATGTTLRLEETNGTVTVKTSTGKEKSVIAGMRLYNGYSIETGASSSAYISLDETKAVKLDSSGKVEIKQQGKKLEVSVTSGQLFFNVTQPLKADESLNIRTSTMVTGIRGSFGWVNQTQMGLMHGHVTLTCINPETEEVRVTEVYSGEMVRYEADASRDGSADPALLEIDFVKDVVTVEDIPAIVVEEIANDESLQAQLAADVQTISVMDVVGSLPEKQTAEAAAEAEAQVQVKAALVRQEESIADSISALAEVGDTSQDYADLKNNTPAPTPTSSDDSSSDDDSGSYVPPVTYYTVTLNVAEASHCTVTYSGEVISEGSSRTISVPSSTGSFSIQLTRDDGYSGGYMSSLPESISRTAYESNGVTTVTFSGITGSTSVSFMAKAALVVDASEVPTLESVEPLLSQYGNVAINMNGTAWAPTGSSLTVESGQLLELYNGTFTFNNTDTSAHITLNGEMRVSSDVGIQMRSDSGISVVSGSLSNFGSIDASYITVSSGGNLYNSQSATLTVNGDLADYGFVYNSAALNVATTGVLTVENGAALQNDGTLTNSGSLTNDGRIDNTNGTLYNAPGGTVTNNGTINN